MNISYEGYLTQQKLKIILMSIYGNDFIKDEVKVLNTRMKWDFLIINNGKHTIVEFDGDQHYRDSLVIMRDNKKDGIAKELGYEVIRIPYFIQLTPQMFKYYFNKNVDVDCNFEHGYIKSNVFPASYCELGIERYLKELRKIPINVHFDINESLRNKSKKYGEKYVQLKRQG